MGDFADRVFLNGEVVTVNSKNEIKEALAIKENKIVFVGSNQDAQKYVGAKTEVIDLKGKSLLPGFIDAHQHVLVRGANSLGIDSRSPGIKSIEELKALIAERVKTTPKGEWIRGWGYDHSKLAENRHPDRFDLDEVAPDHPVVIVRTCNHIAAFNTKALEVTGTPIDATTINNAPVGERNGKSNGVMFEAAYMEVLSKATPSLEEMVSALGMVDGMLLAEGITSVHDAGGHGFPQMKALQQAVESGKLKTRICAMLFALIGDTTTFSDLYIKSGIYTNFGNDHLKLGPIKMMIDGSSSGPTASTIDEYTSMPGNHGLLSMTQEQVDDLTMRAHVAGYQVTSHAVGDRAVTMIVDAIEKALKAHPRKDHRHRIEHCAMVNDELLNRIKALGIIPVPQPIFLYEFGDGYVRNYGDRSNRMFTCGSFIKKGILAAGSSDCPVTFANPLLNMHVAVNRQTQTGQVVGPDEKISLMDAIRMFTYNSAYVSFDEKIKGSLEVGKLADVIVLSEALLKVDPSKIKDVVVEKTYLDGELAYSRDAAKK